MKSKAWDHLSVRETKGGASELVLLVFKVCYGNFGPLGAGQRSYRTQKSRRCVGIDLQVHENKRIYDVRVGNIAPI